MRICGFRHNVSTEHILKGSWTPFRPEYYPFADVDELCNPCYRWRFLELIRGNFPHWGFVLRNLYNNNEEFPGYYYVASRFKDFAVTIMRQISRSSHPDSIIRSIRNPAVLLDSMIGDAEADEFDIFTINLIGLWLERLNSDGIMEHYLSSENTLFNIQVLNENFDVYRHDRTRITLTQMRQSGIGRDQQSPQETFSWRGTMVLYGTIPIIHLENEEIRVPVPIADNFFDPPLDLTDDLNTPEGLRLFFIIKEFHKMWILRESLAQLVENQSLPIELFDAFRNRIFSSVVDLNSYNFRDFNIILDTIDHSIIMDPQTTFRNETGQAAIIFDLLYQSYPGIVNSFQGFDPCPFRIGQDPNVRYNCPMQGNVGCGMSDRRIENLQFPRDRVETNVYKFLRLLRDETVFSHEVLYKLVRLYPERLFDLNQHSTFWIGNIYQDDNQRWIFRSTMPPQWTLPEISDKKYEICLISPLCYEKGYTITFDDRINDNEFVITPHVLKNPWVQDNPFNLAQLNAETFIHCLIGQFSVEENIYNIKRQKRQLVQSLCPICFYPRMNGKKKECHIGIESSVRNISFITGHFYDTDYKGNPLNWFGKLLKNISTQPFKYSHELFKLILEEKILQSEWNLNKIMYATMVPTTNQQMENLFSEISNNIGIRWFTPDKIFLRKELRSHYKSRKQYVANKYFLKKIVSDNLLKLEKDETILIFDDIFHQGFTFGRIIELLHKFYFDKFKLVTIARTVPKSFLKTFYLP